MTQDTYRFAYEEANSELNEIMAQFERLQLRKTQMEQVVEALRPLLSDAPAAAIAAEMQPAAEAVPFLVQSAVETPYESVAAEAAVETAPEAALAPAMEAFTAEPETELSDESSDPFQRRIDNALRQGFGSRDSRVLSLGLNGLLTRA